MFEASSRAESSACVHGNAVDLTSLLVAAQFFQFYVELEDFFMITMKELSAAVVVLVCTVCG